ncbi:MAG: tRNA 2-thiouridine(34) synthase MnmA [bacterium]
MKGVLMGVSGGIDSLAASLYFKENKYNVIPAYIILTDMHSNKADSVRKLYDSFGMKVEVKDERRLFKEKVIDYFSNAYRVGITPNPCAMCNRMIKFPLLKKYSEEFECDFFSTGHYVRILNRRIFKAKDESKDQSYFLSTVKKEDLDKFINTPLADAKKKDIRERLIDKIEITEKESQEICFIDNNDYADFLETYRGFKEQRGSFIDDEGMKIGEHRGYYRYTVGERRNLGMGFNRRMYVKSVDSEKNEVHLTDRENLKSKRFSIEIIEMFEKLSDKEYLVKTRYRQKEVPGRASLTSENSADIILNEDMEAITPGQICAVYEKDMVVASGFITKETW